MQRLPQGSLPSAPPLVLIVDHARDNSEMYALFLSHAGMRVKQAADAEEALAHVIVESPQVVVTDLALPREDGLELCRKIRQRRSHQQPGIIALTGLMLRPAEIDRVVDAGSDVVLFKPCLPETLLMRIRQVLAQSTRLHREARETPARSGVLMQESIRIQAQPAVLQRKCRHRPVRNPRACGH